MSAASWAPPQGRPVGRGRGYLALVLCIVIVGLIGLLTPDLEEEVRAEYDDVTVGQRGHAQFFDATVTDVRLGRTVRLTEYERIVEANPDAVFVVAGIKAEVRDDTTVFNGIELVTEDDHHYDPRGELASLGMQVTQPGFTGLGTVVFEVPKDRLAGSRVVIGPDKGSFAYYDAAIRVDLELDEDARIGTAVVPIAPFELEVTR